MSPPLRRPGGFFVALRKLLSVARLHASAETAYPSQVGLSLVFSVVVLFTLSSMWRALSEGHDLVAMTGWDLAHLVWYCAFTEAITLSYTAPWEGLAVDQEIRSGDVAYRLSRPQSYPLYHVAAYLGQRYARLAIRLPVHLAIAWALVGWPGLSPLAALAAVLAALLAGVADLGWTLTWSFTSFWVEDSFGVHFLYRRCLFLLGGLLVPLSAYPHWLRAIAEALPFKAMLYGPARLFVSSSADGALALFATLLVIAASGFAAVAVLYRLGARRLSAQGG